MFIICKKWWHLLFFHLREIVQSLTDGTVHSLLVVQAVLKTSGSVIQLTAHTSHFHEQFEL